MKHLNGWLVVGLLLVGVVTLGLPLGGNWPNAQILWQLRLPRLLFAVLGGAMLGVSAVIFQTTLRNRYVDGAMLGLASGAELSSAVLIVLLAPALPWRVLTGAILAMAWLVVLRVSILRVLRQPLLLLLGGLAMAIVLSAVTTLITSNQGFLGKSLATVTWQDTWLLAVIGLIGVVILQLLGGGLHYFALPALHVAKLGVDEKRLSWPWQLVAALYVGAVSAVLGTVFFVGLILAQLIVLQRGGGAQSRLLPTGLLGALALSLADLLAHDLVYPIELPTSAMLMLLVAPFLLSLLRGERHGI